MRRHDMAWDSNRSKLVLLGGTDLGVQLALEWDGSDWSTVTGPSDGQNQSRSLAYDPIREEVVAFGGTNGFGNFSGNTWICGSTGVWTQRTPAHAPSDRVDVYLAWCNALSAVILFGGEDETFTTLSETWKWDGTDWTQLSPATSPSAREGAQPPNMACQYGNSVMIFGDSGGSNETWIFDGTTWAQQTPATVPAVLNNTQIAWDPDHDYVLLLGQPASGSTTLTYSWLLGGNNWTDKAPSVSPSSTNLWQTIEWDGNLGKMLMFGARSAGGFTGPETWVFDEPTSVDASIRHTFGLG